MKESVNNFQGLKAVFLNCTLKKSPRQSHTKGLMDVSIEIMQTEGVEVEVIRAVDHEIPYGVQPDMTAQGFDLDEWPSLFKTIIDADILVIGTPIWLGERSSVCSKVIERLYAMSAQKNEKGQYIYYGKVGGIIVTGNEDGVKNCAKSIQYALQHIGYTIPPQADAGWIGAIGPGPSYLDEESGGRKNEFTNKNTTFMTYNLMHLAKMLKDNGGFPAYGNSGKAWEEGKRWAFNNPEYR
ncbi:flavodoxin family protein [Zeaxanthinibacter enoshimensis]|uniref:flavodoxin family protein n=1 Tax=Zeaxanthinibacter enoshimensis TaxID=392009 RepID=UPI003565FFC0